MLVAGVVVDIVSVFGLWNTAKPLPPSGPSAPIKRPVIEKKVILSAEARRVAGRFVLTAVARHNLGESYELVGPQLKAGLTRAQWKTATSRSCPTP